MLPYIYVLGFGISVYSLCMAAAFICCLVLFARGMKKLDCDFNQAAVMACIIALTSLLGAYVLHQVVGSITRSKDSAQQGFVLYGGLIAGAFALLPLCRFNKVNTWNVLDMTAAIIPLGQAIGRIGCLMAGCCYGMEIKAGWGVVFCNPLARAPLNTLLCPVQIYECIFDLLLFAVLQLISKRSFRPLVVTITYVALYGTFRFIIEFFRGDAVRGILYGLSTSQWISLGMILLSICTFVIRKIVRKNAA